MGRRVTFAHTLVIMTSNLGGREMSRVGRPMGFEESDGPAGQQRKREAAALSALRATYSPELVNRLDEVVVFESLSPQALAEIVADLLRELNEELGEQGLTLETTAGVRALLVAEGYSEEYGARELRRTVARRLRGPLSRFRLEHNPPPGTRLLAQREGERVVVAARTGVAEQVGP
jgi:ATP-dependent Clp protease ATP-binding subunit ClpC